MEIVRALPLEKQQEILEHAEKLRLQSKSSAPRWSGKGLWANLHITLPPEEIEEDQREITHSIIWYLAKNPAFARRILIRTLDDPSGPDALAALDRGVAEALASVPRSKVQDLPGRVVGATAVALQVPVVSRDGKIRASVVNTIS